MLSPLLYSLFAYDCTPIHHSDIIIKFAEDIAMVGLISNSNKSANRQEADNLER